MSSSHRRGFYKSRMVRRIVRWLDALPHPMLACEISPQRIAAVRWTRGGRVHELAVEPIPPGALAASAVEPNMANAEVVGEAVKAVFQRLHAHDQDVALLVPDPVIRLFVQHFDEFPRSEQDAAPMLRWKLKKSVPFEAEETLVSYMRQEPRSQGVDVVVGLARLPIVREYEALAEAAGLRPGVVLTSALAAMALLEETRPALLARVCGSSLTTAVVRAGVLCGYRCTDLPVSADALQPAMLLEEVYPLAAYYQDHWQEGIGAVRLGGLGARVSEFVEPVRQELDCSVSSLVGSLERDERLGADAEPLAEQELEGLLGWMQYRSVGEEREAA